MVALVWYAVSAVRITSEVANGMFSPDYDVGGSLAKLQRVTDAQSWMITYSLGANVSTDVR